MNASFKNRIEELRNGGAKVVPEAEMKEILKQYGIPVPKCKLCVSADEAAAFAAEAGFPVVLKLSSDKVLHKTELKGVMLDLDSVQEVKAAFANMDEAFRKQRVPGYLGILVEKQSEKGTELIVGLQYDRSEEHTSELQSQR
jgi:acetyltransferase